MKFKNSRTESQCNTIFKLFNRHFDWHLGKRIVKKFKEKSNATHKENIIKIN